MRIILLFIVFSLLTPLLTAQTALQLQKDYAGRLFEQGKIYDAVTEYKRLIYFDTDSLYFYEAAFQIGRAYKEGAKLSSALKYFTLAEMAAKSNKLRNAAVIEKVRIYILRRSLTSALKNITILVDEYNYDEQAASYWRGWAYLFADDWESAAEEFASCDSALFLKNFCEEVHQNKYSVSFAVVMSYFIPGAGQFYTGNYLSGILSLGWNLLWGYVSVTAFLEERVFDGIMVGNFLFLRFYRGNIQNAENFAEEENRDISNDALRYLQYQYEGRKP